VISGSDGGEYEDESLLEYSTTITLKIEAVRTSETTFYSKTTRRYIAKALIFNLEIALGPARGMDVCLLCLYVVLSCVGLITHPEESYRVSVCV
jgi:hypothetical protein